MLALFDENTSAGPEEIESFLGIELAMRDEAGALCFISDVEKDAHEAGEDSPEWERFAYWEDYGTIVTDVFRINSPQELPAKYPALVLAAIDDDHDRAGYVGIRMVEFVYESEFFPGQPTKDD